LATQKLKFDIEQDDRPIMLFFQDEGRFGRISNLSRCWVSPKTRAIVGKQQIREYVYAYSAVCPHTGENYSLIMPYANSESMNFFVDELSKEYPKYRIILTMDNACWHSSKNMVLPENIRFWHIPPYSPELNPAEHLWDYIRETKKFNNQTFNSIEDVVEKLSQALNEMK